MRHRSGSFWISAALVLGCAISVVVVLGTPDIRDPLLLPAADAGLPPISFYGHPFEGDVFVWVLDRSCSMAWGGIINGAKEAIIDAVEQLSPDQELSFLTFNASYTVWSLVPLPATDGNKAAAITFIQNVVAAGSSCMTAPLLAGLDICTASSLPDRNMFLVGDSAPFMCGGETTDTVIADVTAANTEGVALSTALILDSPTALVFFETLAEMNDGTFINAAIPEAQFLRGDADGNGSFVGLVDGLFVLNYQFMSGPAPPCLDAADADDDGSVSGLVDGIYLLTFQFVAGSPPPPFPGVSVCGVDPTPDAVDCAMTPSSCP